MKRLKLPAPPPRESPEKTIDGRYTVIREIGHGATGTVYEGEQTSVGRRVAIKILKSAYQARPDAKERFIREAKAIARLSHTNCITLYDFGYSEEFEALYMVMELVDGQDLFDMIKDGRLPLRRALKIAIQIAEALAHAHKHGILHRDLKPENVLVTRDLEAKVLDFGLARILDMFGGDQSRRLTADGAVFGTPAYMSPEQCQGNIDVTVHSDIYSLGIVMYQLFQGDLPFDDKDVVQILLKHAKEPAPPITTDVPVELKRLVAKMLEKDKALRPSTANEVAETMRAILIAMAVEDGDILPDVSQEISRSILLGASSRDPDSGSFPATRRTTEGSLPEDAAKPSSSHPPQAAIVSPRHGAAKPGAAKPPAPNPAAPKPAAPRAHTVDLVGRELGGKYHIDRPVGHTPLSTVFAGTDSSGVPVAVKVAGGEVPDELRSTEQLENRVGALRGLVDQRIARFREAGYDDELGRLYTVSEFVDGDDAGRLCAVGRSSTELAFIVARQVAAGLSRAHEFGLVHGALKPTNIMLMPREDGSVDVKILDFATALLFDDDNTSAGSIAYMAPEQLEGAEIDERTDIYALGVILYEMLSGHVPFEARTKQRLAQELAAGAAPNLSEFIHEVPGPLSELVAQMMSRQRARRPRSAAEVAKRIEQMSQSLTLRQFRVQHTGRSTDPQKAWRLRRRVQPPPQGAPLTGSFRQVEPAPLDTVLPPPKSRRWAVLFIIAVVIAAAIYFGLHLTH